MPDMAPHHFDPAFNALGLDAPATIEAGRPRRRSEAHRGQQPGHVASSRARATAAARRRSGTTTASGRRRRSASIPTTREQRLGDGERWPPDRRREGDPHVRRVVGDAAPAAARAAPLVHSVRRRPCRAWPATTPTGCRPARAARRRAATSTTARASPSSCSSATLALRTGKVLKWDAGGHEGCPMCRRRRPSSREATARAGSWPSSVLEPNFADVFRAWHPASRRCSSLVYHR